MKPFRIGLIINPLAGIGGPLALKGSDGEAVVQQALAQGAHCVSSQRVAITLEQLFPFAESIQWFSAPGIMGADLLNHLGFSTDIVGALESNTSTANDTERFAHAMAQRGVDLLLFAGGDGTARNIVNAVGGQMLCLGIPSGVKMHSGCYAVSPQAAARVVEEFLQHKPVSIGVQEVRDIDERALRGGHINAQYYGELLVPNDDRYVQQVKNSGELDDSLIQADIAAGVVDSMDVDSMDVDSMDVDSMAVDDMDMENETLYLIGAGTTPKAVMDELGLDNTLLGVDVVLGRERIAADVTANELSALLDQHPHHPVKLVITATGNQGHIIGRGNQQFSPEILNKVGKNNVLVLITPNKLAQFSGRPLWMDSGDVALDVAWSGWIPIVTGYKQSVVYPLSCGME